LQAMARMNAVLLEDGLLVFDGHEAATVQCAALCAECRLAAWAADGGVASERRAVAMLHQSCHQPWAPRVVHVGDLAAEAYARPNPLDAASPKSNGRIQPTTNPRRRPIVQKTATPSPTIAIANSPPSRLGA
jgi:hypothetical protein